jgi:pimeloyl-ACP methyl ester carboxylesterase
VDLVINLSARYKMNEQPNSRFTVEQMAELARVGRFLWRTERYPSGHERQLFITSKQIEERAAVDMNVVTQIRRSRVLVVHGTDDSTVPHEDAKKLHELMGARSSLALIDGANHSYSQHNAQLLQTIGSWLSEQTKGSAKY